MTQIQGEHKGVGGGRLQKVSPRRAAKGGSRVGERRREFRVVHSRAKGDEHWAS